MFNNGNRHEGVQSRQVIQNCKIEFMKETKDWLKRLNPTLANWIKLKGVIAIQIWCNGQK
jgi:hypothetical protein